MKNKKSVILLICIAIFFSVICAEDIIETTDTDDVSPEVVTPDEDGSKPKIDVYDTQPVILKRVPPIYPNGARRLGIQGDVVLDVEILDDGSVGEVKVFRSLASGPGGLDEAAIEAVKQWEFQPGMKDGYPVTMTIKQVVSFTLN